MQGRLLGAEKRRKVELDRLHTLMALAAGGVLQFEEHEVDEQNDQNDQDDQNEDDDEDDARASVPTL